MTNRAVIIVDLQNGYWPTDNLPFTGSRSPLQTTCES